MFFQKVVKGIAGLSRNEVEGIVKRSGILCNWWRLQGLISNPEKKLNLTEDNLIKHLNKYDDPLPVSHHLRQLGTTYGEVTPFISTTAGAIQRDEFNARNILFDPFMTALRFATSNFSGHGFLFYCYLITIGKKAIELEQFSEEVRELHIYKGFLPYHHEGEIVAKIAIPSAQIERAEEYDGPSALSDLSRGRKPTLASAIIVNPDYVKPEDHSNIRELL
jgi:hypothetical protein